MRFKQQFAPNKILMPFISILIVIYFTYHVFQGDRGVIALLRLQKNVSQLESERNNLIETKEHLEKNVYLLRPDSLDRDLLEERARAVLNFAYPSEIIINMDGADSENQT
jgi:cell division protein FtsB